LQFPEREVKTSEKRGEGVPKEGEIVKKCEKEGQLKRRQEEGQVFAETLKQCGGPLPV